MHNDVRFFLRHFIFVQSLYVEKNFRLKMLSPKIIKI